MPLEEKLQEFEAAEVTIQTWAEVLNVLIPMLIRAGQYPECSIPGEHWHVANKDLLERRRLDGLTEGAPECDQSLKLIGARACLCRLDGAAKGNQLLQFLGAGLRRCRIGGYRGVRRFGHPASTIFVERQRRQQDRKARQKIEVIPRLEPARHVKQPAEWPLKDHE